MKIAVITIVAGRHRHLIRQHEGLARSATAVDSYIVVAMDDPAVSDWHPGRHPFPLVQPLRVEETSLPLAAARNLGARRAIRESADLLVFLDVDCIPSPDLLTHYRAAAELHPDALLSGAVGYLPADPPGVSLPPGPSVSDAHFHSFRPRLAAGVTQRADPAVFWSLSFALTPVTWRRIGGFCEDYSGYGGEDTDFALLAEYSGTELLWVGGAESFHQFHPTSDPPVQHLDDILHNGAIFHSRWGFWPMQGWLRGFEQLGLVEQDAAGGWGRLRVTS